MNKYLTFSAAFAMLAVLAGALGDHRLALPHSSELYQAYLTAVRYQMWHALALFGISLYKQQHPAFSLFDVVAIIFIIAILFFCGGIYLWVITLIPGLRYLVPIGGSLFLLGWVLLLFKAMTMQRKVKD